MHTFIGFFLVLAPVVVMYWLTPAGRYRNILLLCVSVIFISSFGLKQAVFLISTVCIVFMASKMIQEYPRAAPVIVRMTLVFLVGALCFFKYCTPISHLMMPLGLSYVIFRSIHYTVDVYRGTAKRGSFVDYSLYVLFFPTFLAGPVERAQAFLPQAERKAGFDVEFINAGLLRIIKGLVKKLLIADYLKAFVLPVLNAPGDHAGFIVLACVYGTAIQVYMDFSGYTDMALGCSRLFGYKIMENFDRPFFQESIARFWRSWHISVYSWIRDYFFLPVFGRRASVAGMYAGVFTTMIVFMLWHEGTVNFLLLGIYHGAGLIIWNAFQELKARSRAVRAFCRQPYLKPASIFATFSFVSFGFLFFDHSIAQIIGVMRTIFTISS